MIGSVYHGHPRGELEKFGYSIELAGKHGTFEIAGVPRPSSRSSHRREDVLGRATKLGIKSPQGLDKLRAARAI